METRYPAIFFLLLSIYVCIVSLGLGLGAFSKPGPGFLSFWSGIFLGILGFILLIQTIWFSEANGAEEEKGKTNWRAVSFILLSLIGYILFLRHLGFIITTTLFVWVLLKFVEKKGWFLSVLASLALSFACYYFFKVWLQADLPKGIFGF